MLVYLIIYLYVFIVGACIGSFLNVVALRGLSNESIVFPASKCPVCGGKIKWYDNLPIISYLFIFRGKCRNCKCHVSWQYPIVESLTAILFLLTFWFYGISLNTLLLWILLSISIVISITDIKEKSILDKHLWWLIIFAGIYSVIFNGLQVALIGIVSATVGMEILSRILYLLKSKDVEVDEQAENNEVLSEEKTVAKDLHLYLILLFMFAYCLYIGNGILFSVIQFVVCFLFIKLFSFVLNKIFARIPRKEVVKSVKDKSEEQVQEEAEIKDYIKTTKRAFGSGDTYVIAAAGALLGWKLAICVFFLAVVLQVLIIIPQFIKSLFDNNKNRLLSALFAFVFALALHKLTLGANNYIVTVVLFAMLYFAFDTVFRIRSTAIDMEVKVMPFAPALLIGMFVIFFFQNYINNFLTMYFG